MFQKVSHVYPSFHHRVRRPLQGYESKKKKHSWVWYLVLDFSLWPKTRLDNVQVLWGGKKLTIFTSYSPCVRVIVTLGNGKNETIRELASVKDRNSFKLPYTQPVIQPGLCFGNVTDFSCTTGIPISNKQTEKWNIPLFAKFELQLVTNWTFIIINVTDGTDYKTTTFFETATNHTAVEVTNCISSYTSKSNLSMFWVIGFAWFTRR